MKAGVIFGSLIAASAVSYLAYFDYKRHNSAEFRRQLRRNERQYQKDKETQEQQAKVARTQRIKDIISKSLAEKPLPTDLKEREQVFMEEATLAEEYTARGESMYLDAALSYYRALCVYPSPAELLNLYDRSVKKPILDLIALMIQLEPPESLLKAAAGMNAAAASMGVNVD
ncbi:mitochondrial outer membrane translocase complex, subunit Tom20 domain-containing protein [Dipodascopsis tothii]|uniref:mitochondrial outer membrane translocase complex, subunit Tom20 domain-containing protein n=1 Tax=Dipodascopsis tothii TaxID=44089 RepID=UPI0034CD9434